MNKNQDNLVDIMSKFVVHIAKKLPDDVADKIGELAAAEQNSLAKTIYETMQANQDLALLLNRPSCQDTGVLQYWVRCGSNYPLIGELEDILIKATLKATEEAPLRHNCVETFDEKNTGTNIGKRAPYITWDIIPNSDEVEIYPYMAGGGCSLPGSGKTLMPSEGYEGVVKFVLDLMTTYGLNACPPVLVGIGIATSIDTAASLSKKALMRPIGSHNSNERAAMLEKLLEKGLNDIKIGPQGMGGSSSVLGVHIENGARHPSTLSVAVSIGCWNHRRGHIKFTANGNYEVISHKGVKF